MYVILASLILCFIVTIIFALLMVKKKVLFITLKCIFTIGLIVGIFFPMNGYEEPLTFVKEIKIIPIDKDTYFKKLSEDSYMYWVRKSPIIKEEGEEEIQECKQKIITGNVSVIYDKNCIAPVLRVYEGKGKPSEFSYAFLAKTNRYEFIIPEYNPDTENNQ